MSRFRPRSVRLVGAIALLSVLGGGLGACTNIHDHRGFIIDPALTDSLVPGVDNRASVERALGQPTYRAQFGAPVWYYVSIDTDQQPFKRPRPKAETVIRVSFDAAGNVSRIDRTGLERVAVIHPTREKTPTLGRERSFFEDLFGNIGAVGALPGGGAGGPGGPGGGGGGGTGRGPNGS